MMRKVREQPRTTRQELVDDFKAAGNSVNKMTISNILLRSGLKSCGAHKFTLHIQARLKEAIEHLEDSVEGWEKVLWSDEIKLSFLSSTLLTEFGGEIN